MDRHSFLLFCVCIFNKVIERFENDEGFTGVSYRFTACGLSVMDRHSFLLFCVCIFNKVIERFENDEGFTGVSYRFTAFGL
jgi:hypothetical protein